MKEFSFSIIGSIAQGIRNKLGAIRSDKGATSIVNMQLRETGPEPYVDVLSIISPSELAANGIVINYPSPQIFRGMGIMLLADGDAIYEVDTTTFLLTKLIIYDVFDTETIKAIVQDGVWHFADFYDTWFLYNGTSVVFSTSHNNIGFLPDKIFVQDATTIGTGINFRGRLITAGFNPANFWNEEWQFAIEAMKSNLPSSTTGDEAIKKSFIWWTMIANGDTLWQFFPQQAFTRNTKGEFTLQGSRFIEAIERNDMGFMPMPWEGDVYVVKELGGNVVIYGRNGISAIKPVSEPAPTFGLVELHDFGIHSRAAVGGDVRQHIFIDSKGQIWRLRADLSTELLDYSEFIQPILSDNIGVTYDPNTQEFYIGSDSKGYLLGPQGMTEIHQLVTSIINEDGKKGIFEDTLVTTGTIISNIITIGNNSTNTITSIEVDGLYQSGTTVAIDYRYARDAAFIRSRFVGLNKIGWVRFNFSGLEFRVVIQAPDFVNFHPSDITVKWKSHDKRNRRGIDVSQASAG